MNPKSERRRTSPAHEQMNDDRTTKRVVVYTLCALASGSVSTVCWLALNRMAVPETLSTLTTFIVGNISGILTKVGVDAVSAALTDEPVKVETNPDKPLDVRDSESDPKTDTDALPKSVTGDE